MTTHDTTDSGADRQAGALSQSEISPTLIEAAVAAFYDFRGGRPEICDEAVREIVCEVVRLAFLEFRSAHRSRADR